MRLEGKYSVRHGYLPLAALIMHPQMRITINEEGIERLAENIAYHGLRYPICVADLPEGFVVISGHRRLRACRLLQESGRYSEEVAVTIYENLTPVVMALLQASENIHEPVPAHEAAKFYEATWRLLKIHEPAFTLADFAIAVGRSEQTIRNALRFSLLPQRIQEFVQGNSLPYGAAVHLTRLAETVDEKGERIVDETGLEQWAIRFVISKTKVSEAHEQIDQYIRDASAGQLNMLDVFDENARKILEQDSRRILIDRATVVSFWSGVAYLKRLLFLFESGKLELQDSPWLRRNPRRAFLELIDVERRVLEHMKGILPTKEVEEANRILKALEDLYVPREEIRR